MDEFLNVANNIKYGINFTFSFQSQAQIEMLYGQHGAKIILDNCHYKYFLKPETFETAKLISDYLGKETALQQNESQTRSAQGGSEGVSESHMARPLRFPEEVLQADPTVGYLIKAGQYPILIKNRPYYLDDFLKDRAAPNPFHPESEVA